ncbi:MAG: hypothetical protein KA361_02710, partial [Chromatiaceae bacterium]|nr:hypothetical protein [Chromatiaceae bacterium]
SDGLGKAPASIVKVEIGAFCFLGDKGLWAGRIPGNPRLRTGFGFGGRGRLYRGGVAAAARAGAP